MSCPRSFETDVTGMPLRKRGHQTFRQFLDPRKVLVQPIEVLAHVALPGFNGVVTVCHLDFVPIFGSSPP